MTCVMATCKHKTEKIKTRPSRPGRTKEECAGHNGSHGWPTLAADLLLSFLVAKGKRESVRYEGGHLKKHLSASQRDKELKILVLNF